MDRRPSRRQLVQGVVQLGLTLTGISALSGCGIAARAPQPKPVPRIGYLWTKASVTPLAEAFRDGLRDLGYIEGQNVIVEWRDAVGREERLPELTAELVGLPVDILVVAGNPVIQAAKEATRTIPIVMAHSSDAVGAGLVASIARPEANVTGTTERKPLLAGKRLELLNEVLPGVGHVAVLWQPADAPGALEFRETQAAAQTLGVRLQSLEVGGPEDFASLLQSATAERAQALLVFANAFTLTHRARIVELVAQARLPAMYGLKEFMEPGGLMSYAPNMADFFRRAAYYVDRILKGTKPADLPVEQPMRFDFVINLKTANELGLTIPHHVLLQTTEVIQ
jgi:putative tryptophan/tyrosine transport system substrate-binding protein